jgi:hypothetical protein
MTLGILVVRFALPLDLVRERIGEVVWIHPPHPPSRSPAYVYFTNPYPGTGAEGQLRAAASGKQAFNEEAENWFMPDN